jgi:hypothetical protein
MIFGGWRAILLREEVDGRQLKVKKEEETSEQSSSMGDFRIKFSARGRIRTSTSSIQR